MTQRGATRYYFPTRELAVIVLMAALGAVVSVPLGYLSQGLNALAIFPFGAPQLLAGVHILWLIIAALYNKRRGSALATGAIKGLVETTLFSAQGITAIPISLLEGAILEAGLILLGKRKASVVLSGGLSAVGNVIVLRLLILYAFPIGVIAFMAVLAFISGALVSLLGLRIDSVLEKTIHSA
jgi:ABC-type thiamin/hydroxymethylpyrimidine transport system permease subunit